MIYSIAKCFTDNINFINFRRQENKTLTVTEFVEMPRAYGPSEADDDYSAYDQHVNVREEQHSEVKAQTEKTLRQIDRIESAVLSIEK